MPDELDALLADRAEYQHPKLRYWLAERARHPEPAPVYRVEILRQKQGLGFGAARMYLHVLDPAGTDLQPPDEMMWDPDLDEGLIQHGFRAVTPENEVTRFSLAIRRSLMKPERRYGEGYFNSVLHQWASTSPFAQRLAPILAEIHPGNAIAGTEAHADCRDQIQAVIAGRAKDLTERLDWERASATRILAEALGAYLDERFSVSDRRALGIG